MCDMCDHTKPRKHSCLFSEVFEARLVFDQAQVVSKAHIVMNYVHLSSKFHRVKRRNLVACCKGRVSERAYVHMSKRSK